MVEKIIRDGLVAVAVSPGYGSGWSTWNDADPMDTRFNSLFLEGDIEGVEALAKSLDIGYTGGADDVEIRWVPVGAEFIIQEYDGYESLMYKNEYLWYKA